MTEFLFYQVQGEPPETVLPILLERSRDRGWKAVVQLTTPERLQTLDEHLWTYTDDSFLPHGTDLEPNPADHPVLLTLGDANANGAAIRFLVDGAALPADVSGYERLIVLFDGQDEEALTLARAQWREVKASGHEATYWLRDEDGRWRKKA